VALCAVSALLRSIRTTSAHEVLHQGLIGRDVPAYHSLAPTHSRAARYQANLTRRRGQEDHLIALAQLELIANRGGKDQASTSIETRGVRHHLCIVPQSLKCGRTPRNPVIKELPVEVLRTPDERFDGLPGYPFEPHFVDVQAAGGRSLRMHHLDEGPPGGEVVLLLHGEPSWSYLYRKMIPVLVASGLRAVAIDLVGFGRSDKPASRADYTYQAHVDWTWAAIEAMQLHEITLVCQDWGGLIGLRLVGEHPQHFARVVAANTDLPTGDRHPGDAFLAWQRYSQETPELRVGRIISGGCVTDLAPDVVAAYDAPFLDDTYKEGARQFPLLVPTSPDDPATPANRSAWESLRHFERPFLCAFSDSDAITRGADARLRAEIPGAAGQPHTTITGAGHFLQEDRGEELARVVADFVAATPR
jgi:haloalkane dehalogenase